MRKLLCACALLIASVAAGDEMTARRSRLSNAMILAFSGQHEQARPQVEEALKAYRDEKDRAGEGVSLFVLGVVDVAAEKSENGRRHLADAVPILRETGDLAMSMMASWMLAELDRSEGEIDSSLKRHDEALAALQDAAAPGAPFNLDAFILMAPAVGMDTGMMEAVKTHAAIIKPMMLAMFEAMIRDSYGNLLTDAGRFAEAEQQLRRAQSAGGMFGIFDQSIEAHLGDLRRRQWRFEEATEHYKSALNRIMPIAVIPQRDEWIKVHSLGQLAEIEQLKGRIDQALVWNDKALNIVRQSKNRKSEASILESRGDLLLGVSRFQDAEKTFLEALALADMLNEPYRQATITSSLGSLYMLRGDLGRSASTLEKSVALFAKANAAVVESATLLVLAQVYMGLGTHDSAKDALKRARALASDKGFALAEKYADMLSAASDVVTGKVRPGPQLNQAITDLWSVPDAQDLMIPTQYIGIMREVFGLEPSASEQQSASEAEQVRANNLPSMRALRGMIEGKRLLLRRDSSAARAVFLKALQENGSKTLVAPFLAAVGASYWQEGKTDEAASYFEKAVDAVSLPVAEVKVEELLAGYLGSERKWYFDIAIHSMATQGRFEDAFDHSERARARAFLHSLGNARLQPAPGGDPMLVNEAEALRKRIAGWRQQSVFATKKTLDDLDRARQEYQSILKRVKVSNPEYASLTAVEPIRAAEVQRELPPATTMIAYFVGVKSIHAWIIDQQSFTHVSLPMEAQRLGKMVCWAKRLDPEGLTRSMDPDDDDCSASATADEAYRWLFGPLRKHLRNTRLIIVPHGDLHYVPFVALRNSETGRYLIEDFTITYSPSASVLRFLRDKETPVNGKALVLGNPATTLQKLTGAQREATVVAETLGATPKLGSSATESVLYGLAGEYDVVHIAAHAIYEPNAPLFSYVALAKDDQSDGQLDVNDILSSVDFRGVNLVVLSACGTARGARSGGDEIVGLTRAVLYAGSPGVISTLWDVDDDATADLMVDLYERLRGGAIIADALREAQLALLQRKPYSDPRYWAAFGLNGMPNGRWPGPTGAH